MIRLASYNVEWFDALFDDDGRLMEDEGWSARRDVTRAQQIGALGVVFRAMDADAVMVIEAPDGSRRRSTVRALESFAARFGLRARKALIGFRNQTQQEIALLHDPDRLSARHDPHGVPRGGGGRGRRGDHKRETPSFDRSFRWDLDVDEAPETVRFSKPPLEVDLRLKGRRRGLERLRLIGVHVKSKAPHGARGRDAIVRLSIENRRKQLAQSIWLRHRVEEEIAAGEDVIVMGDFNDGPGLDEYEKLFGRSSVEIVLGEGDTGPRLRDPNAEMALSRRIGAAPASARFWMPEQGRYMQALLDYIMVSPGLMRFRPRWRIWHPLDDPECFADPRLRDALLLASDHFPVSLDLEIRDAPRPGNPGKPGPQA